MASAGCPSGGDPNSSPKHSNGCASALDMLRRFHKLQAQRVEGYGTFEEAFRNYMDEANDEAFVAYKQRVQEITLTFKRISEEIIHIKNSLKDTHSKLELSAIIEKIQDLEEMKLNDTAELQVVRKRISEEPEDEAVQQAVSNLKLKLDELASEINEALEDLKYESEDLYAQEIDEDETLR